MYFINICDIDAVYVLAFSTIMLNTDIHNASVKRKMTAAEFVSQNKSVNGGQDFDQEFLLDLYQTIIEDEIRDIDDFNIVLKKGWLSIKATNTTKWKRRWVIAGRKNIYFFRNQVYIHPPLPLPIFITPLLLLLIIIIIIVMVIII